MGLRDLRLATETIKLPEGDLTLRGLSFNDLVILSQEHGPAVSLMFAKYIEGKELPDEDARAAFMALLPQVGDVIGAGIALACDDYTPETVEIAKRLRPSVTLDCLEAIFKLTIVSEADLKKLAESILRMSLKANQAIATMRLPVSVNGSLESDAA